MKRRSHNERFEENYFKFFQWNKLIDGFSSREENGKLKADVVKKYLWFHSPKLYGCYDTYAKMRRYKKEWKGRKQYAGSNSGYYARDIS